MTNEEQIRDLLADRTRLYERQQQCLEALYKTERALEMTLAELALARAVIEASWATHDGFMPGCAVCETMRVYDTWRRDHANTD